jgi:hypothetical protein
MEATEQDLLAAQKASEQELQNKLKEVMVENFLRVCPMYSDTHINCQTDFHLYSFSFVHQGKTSARRKIHST